MDYKKRFFSYLLPQKKRIFLIALFVLIFLIANLSQPLFVGYALDNAIAQNETLFYTFIFVSLGLCICGAFSDFFFEYFVGVMTQQMIFEMRNDTYKKLNSVSIDTIFKESQGNLVQLEIGDVENIANGLFSVFKSLIEGLLAILITIIMMFITNWILALGVILLSPLSIIVSRFVAKFSHDHFKKQQIGRASCRERV